MKTNHKFGMYFSDTSPVRIFIMDDFGNTVELDEGLIIPACDFICTGINNGH